MADTTARKAGKKDVLAHVPDTGDIEMVAISDLNVDSTYQRDVSNEIAQAIAQNLDPIAMGPIVVSRRKDGTLWIVNGQHRTQAAAMTGRTHIAAQVINGLDRTGEAKLRLKGNFRRQDRSQERFRAQLAAGDKESQEINRIVMEYGSKINLDSSMMDEGFNAVASLEWLYRRDNSGVELMRVLDLTRDAWGRVGGSVSTAPILKGLWWFLDKHKGEFDRARLVEKLNHEGTAALIRKAQSHKAAHGGAGWTNLYRALVEVYNDRLPESARLQWRTTGWSAGKRGAGSESGSGLGAW